MEDRPGDNGDDLLLGRLQDAAAGDHALRQLRRRYDLLKADYATLLERLAALEGRLREPGERGEAPAQPQPEAGSSLVAQMRAPLQRLRDEYQQAIAEMQHIVMELDGLAHGRLKSQRGPSREGRHGSVRLELAGGGPGELLDFQEQLSALPGVVRVSVEAVERDRATFAVELGPPGDAG